MLELAEHARTMLASRIGVDQLPALESAERAALDTEPITDEVHAPEVAAEFYPETFGPPKPPEKSTETVKENVCYNCGVVLPSNFVRGTCDCGAELSFEKSKESLF
jgi:hypothetical protein